MAHTPSGHRDGPGPPAVPKSQRPERWLVPGLLGIIAAALLVYSALAVQTASEMRIQIALDRNITTARLCARLLDEDCRLAVSVLGDLANRPNLRAAIQRRDRAAVRSSLSDAVELVPDLVWVAMYDKRGRLLSTYPDMPELSSDASHQLWYNEVLRTGVPSVGGIYRLPDRQNTEALRLAVPLRVENRVAGYVLGYYRLRGLTNWLSDVQMGKGGAIYLVDAGGRLFARNDTGLPLVKTEGFTRERPVRGPAGGIVTTADEKDQTLVAYAYVPTPGWSVIVVQTRSTVLATTDYVAHRAFLFLLPLTAVIVVAALRINYLHREQDALVDLLEESNERLTEADRVKSDFLANVSHDLRTPLAAMEVSVSGLLDPAIPLKPERVRASLRDIDADLERMGARVRNLLEMSRLDAGAYAAQREVDDLSEIVVESVHRLKPLLGDRRILLDLPPEPLFLECDQRQMRIVVSNLLENAGKYSRDGTPLEIRGCQQDGTLRLTVRDHGPGVPPGDEERIFEKFYRSPLDLRTEGTGLGLAICKNIIEAHGGSIRAENAQGGGAIFSVTLPALEMDQDGE